jgi:peptide/nickel transport system substrate-binding protein
MTPRTRSRFVGPIVTALIFLAAILYLRTPGTEETTAAGAEPVRGGQLVVSIRSEPRTFNRFVASDAPTDLLAQLTQGRLVRINRATSELEPWLAERWESSPDGRIHTLHLRPGVVWSDGTPFTSADVLFSLRAVYDRRAQSVLGSSLTVAGQPIRATAPDENTVVLTFAGPSGIGIRLLDNLPVLPRHRLETTLEAGTFPSAWDSTTPLADIAGTGPFVLRTYEPGERVVLDRNPHYWRTDPSGTPLPYLDRIVLQIVPDQNAELLRLQSGDLDMTQSELRPEDYVPIRRAEQQGRLRVIELGVSPDADAFWFCLKPEARRGDPRFEFVQRREFRQALSHAVDREEFAHAVFLSEAVPVWGPITPGNRAWFNPNLRRYPYDPERARELLRSIGLDDRTGNGIMETAAGVEARFTVITQGGISHYERGTTVLRERAAAVGVALDVVPLEAGAMIQRLLACDYDAIYMRPLATDLDPAGNMDLWLSSGSAHLWNREQRTPATEWERRIDILMTEQAAALDPERRRQLFDDVQAIFAENLPVLYFAAPRMYAAHTARVGGVVPSVQRPHILWNADRLWVVH